MSSGGSRPSDKGGGGEGVVGIPDPEKKGERGEGLVSQNKFFRPLGLILLEK